MDPAVSITEQKNKLSKKITLKIVLISIFIIFIYLFISNHTNNKDVIIHVSNGQSVNSIVSILKEKNVIKNDFLLKFFIKIFNNGKGIISGDYLIKKNSSSLFIGLQLSRGIHGIDPIRVTIREGLDNEEIASLLSIKITSFRKDLFLLETISKQGYLFPDTYFLYPLDTTEEIIDKLSNNFNNRIKNLDFSIKESGKNLQDIIIMASILEGEAKGEEDIYIISGILWKRLSMGMPLQVDVDKNTYINKGLPEKPLNNPGLMSINGAINSISSKYLYYLHDKNGKVHYAANYEEHKSNINKYLK